MTDEYQERHHKRTLTRGERHETRIQTRCPDCGTWVTATVLDGTVDEASALCSDCHGERGEVPVGFGDLREGDRVLLLDRTEPLTVASILNEGYEQGRVTVVAQAGLSGPQGGTITLEQCATGRLRATVSSGPRYTIDNLRRVGRGGGGA